MTKSIINDHLEMIKDSINNLELHFKNRNYNNNSLDYSYILSECNNILKSTYYIIRYIKILTKL